MSAHVGDMPVNTILEIYGGRVIPGSCSSTVALVDCSYMCEDKTSYRGKMIIPGRFFKDVTVGAEEEGEISPRVMIYLGKKTFGNNHSCFLLHDAPKSKKNLSDVANELRALTSAELIASCTISSLGDFPEQSVFICTALRVLAKDYAAANAWSEKTTTVAQYERVDENGKVRIGEVFFPSRYVCQVRKNLPTVCIYKGLKKSQKGGRSYHDVSVVREEIYPTAVTAHISLNK